MTLVEIYGVAGHGKGEVDHVGGLAKVAIRREVAAGQQLSNAEEMINCFEGKFGESESPIYVFKEIKTFREEKMHHCTRITRELKDHHFFK